jgi:transposase
MGKARSEDLRSRVVAEVAGGLSRRKAAERFKVSVASAVRWVQLYAQTGSVRPRRRGGKSRSPLEPHAAWLLALAAEEADLTLEAFKVRIAEELGIETSLHSIHRFFRRHRISFKKNSARRRAGQAGRGRGAGALESGSGRA